MDGPKRVAVGNDKGRVHEPAKARLLKAAGVLRHDIRSPAAITGLDIDELLEQTQDQWTLGRLSAIRSRFDYILYLLFHFTSHIDEISEYGGYSIRELLTWARNANANEATRLGIQIELLPGPDFTVYCSPILQYHLVEVVQNACRFVERRLEMVGRQPPGRIEIRVEEATPPDEQGQNLNRRIRIAVWDNGVGVPREPLAMLGESAYTESPAVGHTGFGLFALRNYVQHLGGSLRLNSQENEYFEVAVTLDQYDPVIHDYDQLESDDGGQRVEGVEAATVEVVDAAV